MTWFDMVQPPEDVLTVEECEYDKDGNLLKRTVRTTRTVRAPYAAPDYPKTPYAAPHYPRPTPPTYQPTITCSSSVADRIRQTLRQTDNSVG